MNIITFLIHTKQPLLATSLQGDPNSDVSHDYILGSMIRGGLIGRYFKQKGIQKSDDILDSKLFPDIKRLFFDDSKTRYLNAYPVDINRKRTLPTPRSWYKDKTAEFSEDKETSIYDFSQIPIDERDEELSPKLIEEKFCTVSDTDVLFYRVKRRINIHNQRDRKRGRGIDSNGAVFSYDAIDAGQTFQAIILCDSEQDKDTIESVLQTQDIWLGGSQSAGYGHATIELIPNSNSSEVETDLTERLWNKTSLTITLLSNTIIRDEYGQCSVEPEALRQAISKILNINEKSLEFENNSIYSSTIIVGGFNRTWGLPLPQTPAFTAGSVFVFKPFAYELKKIQELEEQGIGERRVEGFGRVVFNWLKEESEYQAKLSKSKPDNSSAMIEAEPLSQDSLKIAGNIALRNLRKKLDNLLLKAVSTTEIQRKEISNSQLSRLMIINRQVLSQLEVEQTKIASERKNIVEIIAPIKSLLQNLPANARSQFERTRLKNLDKRFDEQINEWLKSPQSWINESWISDPQTRNLLDNGQPFIKIAGVPKRIDDYLALEYTLRLIIAIVKKTIKEKNND
ncbi:MAG: hypothetical protein KME64_02925 [Scytonematopsis contorta HA4267-MV1]|jgi:CRISPR-associated protein Csx10|nr:hypothetical protein [Scytonematopsis contorta HA4267-MV1]